MEIGRQRHGDWETDAWGLGDRGMEIGRQMHGDWETDARR